MRLELPVNVIDVILNFDLIRQFKKGYTKNQAVKNMPMASKTTVRWGNTAGFTGLVYLVMASSSCRDKQFRHIAAPPQPRTSTLIWYYKSQLPIICSFFY